jgi:hypothetical protein
MHCGKPLQRLKTDSSWDARYRCLNCGARLHVSYGDGMGGASNSYHWSTKPFPVEEPKREKE